MSIKLTKQWERSYARGPLRSALGNIRLECEYATYDAGLGWYGRATVGRWGLNLGLGRHGPKRKLREQAQRDAEQIAAEFLEDLGRAIRDLRKARGLEDDEGV